MRIFALADEQFFQIPWFFFFTKNNFQKKKIGLVDHFITRHIITSINFVIISLSRPCSLLPHLPPPNHHPTILWIIIKCYWGSFFKGIFGVFVILPLFRIIVESKPKITLLSTIQLFASSLESNWYKLFFRIYRF